MANDKNYRERVPVPGWAAPALGAIGALWVIQRVHGTARKRSWLRAAWTGISSLMTALTLLRAFRGFARVAIEVERDSICMGVGPIEKRIPSHAVQDVRIVTYNPVRFLGWGYRLSFGGRRAFSQFGVPRGVEITTHEDGVQRRYFVSSNEPEALAAAVAAAAGVESL